MARSKSSNKWLREHEEDEYVLQARRDNYRSRAVYKLIQIDEKEKLLKPGLTVIELGAAPGSWTQYVVERLRGTGSVIASDILPMDSFADVNFIQGDFNDQQVLDEIADALGKGKAGKVKADLVLSDMAPNLSGVSSSDQARAMGLAELAHELAREFLQPGGSFVTKLFQGEGFDDYVKVVRRDFEKLTIRKPDASRGRSREVFAVARNLLLV